MKMRDTITPDGTKDLIFEEYDNYVTVSQKITDLFVRQGYKGVLTPTLEYYDVFAKSAQYLPLDVMYKLVDEKGRLLVLCPDCTIPVARLVTTRLKDQKKPLRLYYHHNIYRMELDKRGKPIEVNQIGIELVGGVERKSDFEVVELASDCMKAIGEQQYRFELCHIGYFKAIMQSMDMEEDVKETIHRYIEQKNYAALTNILEPYKEQRAARALLQLPRLFGGMEVIEQAYTLFDENGAKESLDDLKRVYEYVQSFGEENQVMIDLGLVNQADYYTGIIFRGYLNGIGEPVLSGGRYDKLLGEFGEDSKAIGFGINVGLASKRISKQEDEKRKLIVCAKNESYAIKASKYQRQLREEGMIVINSVLDCMEDVIAYAKQEQIKEIHIVGDEVEVRKEEMI